MITIGFGFATLGWKPLYFPLFNSFNRVAPLSKLEKLAFCQESMKNLRDSLPSWIDSDRAAAVGSLKVRLNSTMILSLIISKTIKGDYSLWLYLFTRPFEIK